MTEQTTVGDLSKSYPMWVRAKASPLFVLLPAMRYAYCKPVFPKARPTGPLNQASPLGLPSQFNIGVVYFRSVPGVERCVYSWLFDMSMEVGIRPRVWDQDVFRKARLVGSSCGYVYVYNEDDLQFVQLLRFTGHVPLHAEVWGPLEGF